MKYRNNQIPEENLEKIQSSIEKQMEYFNTIPMGSDIMEEALKSPHRKACKEFTSLF